ncbi:hypothetical protein [Nostoc sp.]|uniref:hypothetical protein n=1 Tax=Nostoc sp. TaxID=1180 RepID=UPI002FF968F3
MSGLPRSGSTLLGALLRQNPRFHASMTSPVGSLVNRMLEAMSEENEYSVFITREQKRALTLTIFSTYYQPEAKKEVIFDTNRLNTKGLHQVRRKVEFQPRLTILPPDLFTQYDALSFWKNPSNSLANVIVAQPVEAVSK